MIAHDVRVKVCVRCGTPKPWTEFHRHSRAHDGLQSRCKQCDNRRRKTIGGRNKCRDCPRCAGLTHRVVGPKCRVCGLLYADDVLPSIDDIASQRTCSRSFYPSSLHVGEVMEKQRRATDLKRRANAAAYRRKQAKAAKSGGSL